MLKEFEPEIESLTLTPSEGGRFEVIVNDRLIYSKLHTRRHAETGEINQLIKKLLKESA